uniref:Uncharacterized protein n=1 Tax=Chenopodium quinoa TaxID=63459 RepID=A0A803MTC7_CHEQI
MKHGMSILMWNARGIARRGFKRNIRQLLLDHNLEIVVLNETNVQKSGVEEIIDNLSFNSFEVFDPVGLSGGILVLWKSGVTMSWWSQKNHGNPRSCLDVAGLGSEYVQNAKVIGIPISRHTGRMEGKGIIGHKQRDLSYQEWHWAHTYILFNEDEVAPYAKNNISFLKQKNQDPISGHPFILHVYNGCTFYTEEQDKISTMQNSGVVVEAEAMHFASAKDNSPSYGKMWYYGIIEQIIEMHYNGFTIPIFRCKWVNNNSGVEYEDIGFTLVNFDKLGFEEDPLS